ncbi:MAG: hypothetical protein AB8H86_05500 [Polyangiales bacterium]
MKVRCSLVLALLVASCGGADESLFELVVPVPAQGEIAGIGPISHMAVQVRFGSDVSFALPWSTPVQEVIELTSTPTDARFFVFGEANSAEALNVRVVYCASDDCGVVPAASRAEHHARIARVLYDFDEPTSYTLSDATLDTASANPELVEIDACAVAGCGATQSLACDLNGVHRCE